MFILTKFKEFRNGTYGVPGLLPRLPALPWRVSLREAIAWEWEGLKWKVGWCPTITGGSGPSQCRERSHISLRDFGLWDWMNSVCISRENAKTNGTEKKAYEHTDHFTLWPERAGMFNGGASRYTIRRAASRLVKAGWLEVVKERTDGPNGAGVYRVIRHAEWVKRHGFKKCIRHAWDEVTGEQIS